MFKKSFLAAALASVSWVSFAEDSVESVIVSATRTPVDYSETLAAVSVLERQDIERIQAQDLFDLLAHLPGVSFSRNGGRGASTSLSLRGNQGDHSLFLVDGVRVGSATLGSASLGSLNLASVERIEIIRGPKSALYGADAIGGVVNIITRRIEAPKEAVVEAGYGNNAASEFSAFGGVKGDSYQLSVSANAFDTDGIDHTESKQGASADDDAYENRNVAVRFISSGEKHSVNLSYNRNETENQYDSNCGDASTFAPVECFIYSENTVDALSAKVAFDVSKVWRSELHLGRTHDENDNLASNIDLATTYNGGEFNTRRTEATWLNHVSVNAQHTLTIGADYIHDDVSGSTDYTEESRFNRAGFVQWQADFGVVDAVSAYRHDDNEQFGSHATHSATFGVDVSEQLRVIASYGEGFKAPTFNDLYFPDFGNDTFEPEESKNYELGLKANVSDTFVNVAVYKNDIKNLIQYNPAIFAADQTAEAEIEGLEFDISKSFGALDLALSGQFINPVDKANDKLLRRRAKRTASVSVDYNQQAFGLGATVRGESRRFEDAANTDELGGYALLDLRGYYSLNDEWKLKLKLNNALDKRFTTARSFGLGDYQSVGREVFVSIQYTPAF